MKNKALSLLGIFVAFLFLFSACEKSEIEKAQEDYDYDKIIPMILGKSGPANVMRTYTGTFQVANRGGSVFTWNIEGADLKPYADFTYKTQVFFPSFNNDEDVIITVYETTKGGLVSETDTLKATVTPFLAPSISGENEITIFSGEPDEDTYSVSNREGSTYAWSTTGGTIASTNDDWEIKLQVTQADVGSTITLTCNETHLSNYINDVPSTFEVLISEFCALVNGLNDMVGAWSGTDAWYESIVTTVVEDETHLAVNGLSVGLMEDWWGEEVIEGGTISMTVNLEDGTVDIPRQYIYTTDWEGDPYDYEIEGAGTWVNCGPSPKLLIQYDIYYPGEDMGLAATYSPAYLPTPYMTADITLDNTKSKSGQIIENLLKPSFKK